MVVLKIAMIGSRGLPSTSGGVEVVVEEISTRLICLGMDVTVFCRPHYTRKRPLTYKCIKLKYIPCINTKHFEAISHAFFCSIVAAFSSYDIVHYHSLGPSLMSWIPRIFGKKVVSTCHGLDWKRNKWGKIAKIMLILGEKFSSIFPHRTTVVSKVLQEYFKNNYYGNYKYIPNGVSLPDKIEDTSFLTKYGLEKNGYILFLSRIVPEKGLQYLIRAYKKIYTGKKLVIAGEHSHTESYFDEINILAKNDDRIIFTGNVFGKEKDQLFFNAFCFVLPSDIEGMPIVLLEALAYGCVVLVSDIPVNKSIVEPVNGERYGYSFAAGNVNDLQEKLEYILDNSRKLYKTKTRLKYYVLKNFDWLVISKQYYNFYQALVLRKKRSFFGMLRGLIKSLKK